MQRAAVHPEAAAQIVQGLTLRLIAKRLLQALDDVRHRREFSHFFFFDK
jgi:hypothetical protein